MKLKKYRVVRDAYSGYEVQLGGLGFLFGLKKKQILTIV